MKRNEAREGHTSIFQLARERRNRDAIYGAPSYWDSRASARAGLARSLWPSNVYNEVWDERQRALLHRVLGSVEGRRVVDVGCGTGRMTRFFADVGAKEAVGIDFSAATVAAAEDETRDHVRRASVRFVQGDVVASLDHVGKDFDDAIVLGCFSVACRDRGALARAFANVAKIVRTGGRVIVLEPIHRSPILRRILDLGVEEWISCANEAGLRLTGADRMGFAPVRFFLSVRDLPRSLVRTVFRAGERLLDEAPYLAPTADYKLLAFEKTTDHG